MSEFALQLAFYLLSDSRPESVVNKKIIIASKNPVKIQAVLEGFKKMFPKDSFEIREVLVDSGVSNQPSSNKETLDGAYGRATNAMKNFPNGNYYVGVEGGVEARGNEMESFAWVVVRSNKIIGKGKTGTFFLPDKVIYWINQGKELGEADDIVFKKSNSKQKNGAIGILTGNIIDRKEFYKSAVITALIPFKNKRLYKIR